MFITRANALTCKCNCGPSSPTPSASCTTSTQCSQICYWGYSQCYAVSTQGCCGTLNCTWYSGDRVYNEPGTCVCKCASSYGTSVSEQGRAQSSSCSASTCQSACQYMYPSTCGTYTNQAYCSSISTRHQIGTSLLVFLITIAVYFTRK